MKKYNYIYAIAYKYYERIWGKGKNIVSFNVTLGLSLSMLSVLVSVMLILYIFFDVDWIFILTNKIATILLLATIILIHYFKFEYADKYKTVIDKYDKELKLNKNNRANQFVVFVYLFGSVLCMILLAFLAVKN